MAAIIAGGAGFIGINLVQAIINKESQIFIIDNFSNSNPESLSKISSFDSVKIIDCDLSDKSRTNQVIKNISFKCKSKIKLWHLAANSDIPSGVADPHIDFRDTFITTFNLLESCKENNIRSFYFASSSAIYGDHGQNAIKEDTGPLMPISNYGAMKLASEAQCFASYESFLENLRIYRFPNVVGIPATHGVIFDFINKLIKTPKELNVLGDGSQEKSYLHVDDLISGMLFLAELDNQRENIIFNLGPQKDTITVKWIAEEVVRNISPKAKIVYGNNKKGWIGDVPKFLYNTDKAIKAGWNPKLNSKQSVGKAIKEIKIQLT